MLTIQSLERAEQTPARSLLDLGDERMKVGGGVDEAWKLSMCSAAKKLARATVA